MPAEYCSLVWNQSPHANAKLNTPFNEALHTISECIMPTCANFLPFLAGIESLENRRHYAFEKLFGRRSSTPSDDVLFDKLTRLHSWHPLRNLYPTISVSDNSVPEDLAEFILQWLKESSGCKLPHKQWVQLNILRSWSEQFADDIHHYGLLKQVHVTVGKVKKIWLWICFEFKDLNSESAPKTCFRFVHNK